MGSLACGGAHHDLPPAVARLDTVRQVPKYQAAREGAPQVFNEAERFRELALKAHSRGDVVGAELLAARAEAMYERAFVLARRATAERALEEARASRSKEEAALAELLSNRQRTEADAEALEKQVAVSREPTAISSGPASGPREAARRTATRSLLTEARLLCASARLLGGPATGLDQAEGHLAKVEGDFGQQGKGAPIDAAAQARSACLSILSTARQTSSATGRADELLAKLSAGGWAPIRDERGVVVTLIKPFQSGDLSVTSKARLSELATFAKEQGDFAIQLVMHQPASGPNDAKSLALASETAAKLLRASGVSEDRYRIDSVGGELPVVVSKSDVTNRNERVDVVFVVGDN